MGTLNRSVNPFPDTPPAKGRSADETTAGPAVDATLRPDQPKQSLDNNSPAGRRTRRGIQGPASSGGHCVFHRYPDANSVHTSVVTDPGATPDAALPPATGRYAAVDVYYPAAGGAIAAVVIAADPTFTTVLIERTAGVEQVEPYRPGRFFARELPPLRAVLAGVDRPDLLVIDGYVHLDPAGRPGLGAHANAVFDVPVIGVAKTAFRTATHAIEVYRGGARRPLYVTSVGIPAEQAAALVLNMAGRHRMPDALRRVDTLSRTGTGTPSARVHR